MKPEILHNDHMMFLDRALETQRTALLTAMADAVSECRTAADQAAELTETGETGLLRLVEILCAAKVQRGQAGETVLEGTEVQILADVVAQLYDRRKQTKDDYVFRRKGMELPMTPSTFTWRFKKILKANDLPTDLNVHSLRHTAASLFIASGTDVGTVAGLLGHSQPSTTLDIYTHAFDKNKKAASQIMQSSLEI